MFLPCCTTERSVCDNPSVKLPIKVTGPAKTGHVSI